MSGTLFANAFVGEAISIMVFGVSVLQYKRTAETSGVEVTGVSSTQKI